jgi:heat shock protein HslJ
MVWKIGATCLLLAAILGLAACQPVQAPPTTEDQPAGEPLEGTVWLLDELAGEPALADVTVTAQFGADGTLGGSGGCNSYGGPYTVDGDQITIGPLASTMMACAEEIMDQEIQYLAALESAATFSVSGVQLEMRMADGALAVTAQRSQTPAESTGAETPPMGQPPDEELAVTLANMTYQSEFTASGTVTLTNGIYEEPAAPGSATMIEVQLLPEYTAVGELNGEPAAAVILATESGGSGVFFDLAVVMNVDGQPTNVATTLLGDRVEINAVRIENNQVVVDMVTQGPNDPMCCPTQQVVQVYELEGSALVAVNN